MFKTREDIKNYVSITLGINPVFLEVGKIFQGKVSVFYDLKGKILLIGYDKVNYQNKDEGFRIVKLLTIPEDLDLTKYPKKSLEGNKEVIEVPIDQFKDYSSEASSIALTSDRNTVDLEERSRFVDSIGKGNVSYKSMTQRVYACIHLKVPLSGEPWLDELIEKANDLHNKNFTIN